MPKLIKIDKRNSKEGYCILAGDGVLNIVQGGNGSNTRSIELNDSDLQTFIADLENVVTELSAQLFKRAS